MPFAPEGSYRVRAVKPAVQAGHMRQSRSFEGQLRFAFEVDRDADFPAGIALGLRPFPQAHQVNAVVPEMFVDPVRLGKVFILLHFRRMPVPGCSLAINCSWLGSPCDQAYTAE